MLEEEEIEEKDSKMIDEDDYAIICSKLGFDDEKIVYGTIKELIEYDKKEILKEPLCVIIPGDMHEMEEEFLNQFKI
jgi:diphthamide biosynthesis methyltransferase